MENTITSNEKQARIYTFWSPQIGSGSTFLSYQTAKTLADKGYKTILLDWDFRTPTLTRDINAKDTLHYLDNLLPSAVAKNVSQELLNSYISQKDEDFYFMSGIENPEQALDIVTDGLEYILELLKPQFDFIIIDVNTYIDNAGTFVGLFRADKVLFALEKKFQAIRNYEYYKSFIEEENILDFDKFELVLNKVDKAILLSSEEVEKYFNKERSIEITNLGVEFINEDNIGKSEEFLKTSKKAALFHSSIDKLIDAYIDTTGLVGKDTNQRKKDYLVERVSKI